MKFSDKGHRTKKIRLHITYHYSHECFYQEEITLDKQFETGFEKEADKMLYMKHCSLRVRNMDIK